MILFLLLLVCALFMHIVDDYYLQGCLANLKQKRWWREQPNYTDLYKYDYVMALIEHAFSWSFCIHVPMAIYFMRIANSPDYYWCAMLITFVINVIMHAFVDNQKANKFRISLVTDQLSHIAMIVATYGGLYIMAIKM